MIASVLLVIYGCFLIGWGIMAVVLIGLKAKTALISGGFTGLMAIGVGYWIHSGSPYAPVVGIILTLALFGVFAWRSTLTFYKVAEYIPERHIDLNDKIKAFLIIAMMAVVSMVVSLFQLVILLS
jgi:hypothetical protein